MASNNSIRRAILRPGHFLSLHSDRQLYVSPVQSLGGFSVLLEMAATGWPLRSAEQAQRLLTPRLGTYFRPPKNYNAVNGFMFRGAC